MRITDAIPLSQPDISDIEIRAVVETLKSGQLSLGPKTPEFERHIARRSGRSHGVAVNSGTSGLHLILAALGVGPGDEVITPAFSFVASANCVLQTGATPIFADCEPRSMNVSPDTIGPLITDRTRAIIAVEVFGNPANMPQIEQLCNSHEIPLVEDCCEAIGSTLNGRPAGHFGRAGAFSFYPNKQMTTAEGGMIVTDDDHLADTCRSMRNQGRGPMDDQGPGLGSWFAHQRMGFNYRMSELHASLGIAQFLRLNELLAMRGGVAQCYMQRLAGNTNLILPTIEPNVFMSWFVFVVRLTREYSESERNEIIEGLRRHDIGAASYFPVIPLLPFFRETYGYKLGDFPCAESVSQRTIALPFFNSLTDHEVDVVCQTLELMITRATFSRRSTDESDG